LEIQNIFPTQAEEFNQEKKSLLQKIQYEL
jgi:hypothetical protein